MSRDTSAIVRKPSRVAYSATDDDFYTLPPDSEPASSVIRLTHLLPESSISDYPPPLPPPLPSSPTPPPLPLKPSFARSETFIIHPSSTPTSTTTTDTATVKVVSNNNHKNNNNKNNKSNKNNNAPFSPTPPPLPPKPEHISANRQTSYTARPNRFVKRDDDFGLSSATVLDESFNLRNLIEADADPIPPQPDRRTGTEVSDAVFPDKADFEGNVDPDSLPVRLLTAEAFAATIKTPGTQLLIPELSFGSATAVVLPFATPPFTAKNRAICATLLPIFLNGTRLESERRLDESILRLSKASMEDVDIGAIQLSQSRVKNSQQSQIQSQLPTQTQIQGHINQPQQPVAATAAATKQISPNHFTSPQFSETLQYDKLFLTPPSFQPPPISSSSPPPLPPQPTNPLPPIPQIPSSSSFAFPTKLIISSSSAESHKIPEEEYIWSVLRDYLTNTSLGSHGRARALRMLATAACDEKKYGEGVLREIVKRMQGTERSERDGSIFTLLIHVATGVENVHVLNVFSDVVEEMHGRQDDRVMWERAIRCYLLLIGKAAVVSSVGGLSMSFSSSSNISLQLRSGYGQGQGQSFQQYQIQQQQQEYDYDMFEYDFLQQQQYRHTQIRSNVMADYEGYHEENHFDERVYDENYTDNKTDIIYENKDVINNDGNTDRIIDDVTIKCIVALALHVGDVAHADIDNILVTQALCTRLRNINDGRNMSNNGSFFISDHNVDMCALEDIGGIEILSSLFADTPCMSARHSLFGIIFDVAISETVDVIEELRNQRMYLNNDEDENASLIMRDQVTVLRSFIHAHDVADLLVHAFRVGPWNTFVPDLMRLLILQPLTNEIFPSPPSCIGHQAYKENQRQNYEKEKHVEVENQKVNSRESVHTPKPKIQVEKEQELKQTMLQKRKDQYKDDSIPYTEKLLPGYVEPTKIYLTAVTTIVKQLDKSLFLRVFRRIQNMAQRQTRLVNRHETNHHHPREWRIAKEAETLIQNFHRRSFCTSRNCPVMISTSPTTNNSSKGIPSSTNRAQGSCGLSVEDVNEVLDKLHSYTVDLTSERVSPRRIVRFIELIIEFFTTRPPFSPFGKLYGGIHSHQSYRYRYQRHLSNHYHNTKLQNQQNVKYRDRRHQQHQHHHLRNKHHYQYQQEQNQRDIQNQQYTGTNSADSIARLFLHGYVVAIRSMLERAKPELFTSLLIASRQHASVKRISENRQCLIEFLGVSEDRVSFLNEFKDDEDAAVAYRARELVSKYPDPGHVRSRSLSTSGGE